MNKYVALVVPFTIFAGADIDALNFFCSNFAEISMLNAPIGASAKRYLKIIGISSMVYRDIPKLCVQVSDFLKLFLLKKILLDFYNNKLFIFIRFIFMK